MRALRLDKTILAALSATLDLYLAPNPTQSVPILQLISTPLEELQTRAQSLAESISEISDFTATAMEDVTYLGGGSVPTQEIETWSVSIKHAQRSDDELSLQLRTSLTPVLGRIRQNESKLDLRSVFPHQDLLILEAFQNI